MSEMKDQAPLFDALIRDRVSGFTMYWDGDDTICLDDHYTAAELRAIADAMEATQRPTDTTESET